MCVHVCVNFHVQPITSRAPKKKSSLPSSHKCQKRNHTYFLNPTRTLQHNHTNFCPEKYVNMCAMRVLNNHSRDMCTRARAQPHISTVADGTYSDFPYIQYLTRKFSCRSGGQRSTFDRTGSAYLCECVFCFHANIIINVQPVLINAALHIYALTNIHTISNNIVLRHYKMYTHTHTRPYICLL